jgi:hypothetical protein
VCVCERERERESTSISSIKTGCFKRLRTCGAGLAGCRYPRSLGSCLWSYQIINQEWSIRKTWCTREEARSGGCGPLWCEASFELLVACRYRYSSAPKLVSRCRRELHLTIEIGCFYTIIFSQYNLMLFGMDLDPGLV